MLETRILEPVLESEEQYYMCETHILGLFLESVL